MIDRYLDGRVERISPEAPVPVMRLGKEDNRLGGAANVALNLQALGAEVLLAGVVGDDENGQILRDLLTERGLTTEFIITDPDRCTTVKTRLVAQGQQLLRVDREETFAISAAVRNDLSTRVRRANQSAPLDVVLLQDYNKGVLTPDLIEDLSSLPGGEEMATVPVVVDPKDRNFWAFAECALFKPNLREIQQQVNFPVRPVLEDLDRAAALIFERLGCASVMITLSEHGIYVNDRQTSTIYPTDARDVRDVSGAGDTVISVVAWGIGTGRDLASIARLANLAGAQVIAKSGVVAVDAGALLAAFKD